MPPAIDMDAMVHRRFAVGDRIGGRMGSPICDGFHPKSVTRFFVGRGRRHTHFTPFHPVRRAAADCVRARGGRLDGEEEEGQEERGRPQSYQCRRSEGCGSGTTDRRNGTSISTSTSTGSGTDTDTDTGSTGSGTSTGSTNTSTNAGDGTSTCTGACGLGGVVVGDGSS